MCGVIEWSIIYMKIFLIYLLLMNIAGFAAMGIDKCKAKAHAWRIPEKTLFGLSLLGGSAGTWAEAPVPGLGCMPSGIRQSIGIL